MGPHLIQRIQKLFWVGGSPSTGPGDTPLRRYGVRPDFVPAMDDDYEEPGKRKRARGHQDDTSGPQTARFSDSMPFGCASGRPFFEAWRGVVTGES